MCRMPPLLGACALLAWGEGTAGSKPCPLCPPEMELNWTACSLGEKWERGNRQAGLQNMCDLYTVHEFLFLFFFNRAVYDLVLVILVILAGKCCAILCDFVSSRGPVRERDRKGKFRLKNEVEIFLPKNMIFSMSTFKCELFWSNIYCYRELCRTLILICFSFSPKQWLQHS